MSIFHDISNLLGSSNRDWKGAISVYKIYKHGELTWLVDSADKQSSFLHLYSASTLKAKMFKLSMKVIWKMSLQSFFFKKEEIRYSNGSFIDELLKNDISNFALFTGTVGENRKLVFYFTYMGMGQFVKFPFGSSSKQLVEKEYKSLSYLNELKLTSIIVPSLTKKTNFSMISDVCTSCSVPYNILDDRAFDLSDELLNKTSSLISFQNLDEIFGINSEIEYIKSNLSLITNASLKNIMTNLSHVASCSVAGFSDDFKLTCAYAHGDFTPWNSFSNKSGLALIDWELSGVYPAFFDLIHFTVSKNALLGDFSPELLRDNLLEINRVLVENKNAILNDNSFNLYIKLYSLISISIYGKKFLSQDNDLHDQAYILLNVWKGLLTDA